jgi:plastocyanin domain-containing protein
VDISESIVLFSGIVLIALILWYFFGDRAKTEATADAAGVQEVSVVVRGGYAPDTIQVRAGQPVRLKFYRDETSACSEQVVLGDFGIARDLPAYQTTAIEFTPDRAGEYTFTCGMNMMRGKLIVRKAV